MRAILKDAEGALWVGTHDRGLWRFLSGRWENWGTREGLGHVQVHHLLLDSEGTLWIGTQMGLNRFSDGKLQLLTARDGLFDNVVNQVLEDDAGYFWIGCNRGIYRVQRRELNAAADGRSSKISCVVYGESDGMPVAETNGEHQPSACETSDGKLWFPTPKGVVVVDPKMAPFNDRAPNVIVERVVVDGETIYSNSPAEDHGPARDHSSFTRASLLPALPANSGGKPGAFSLPAGRGVSVEIHYAATSFAAPEKVRFRCKLSPDHNDWHEDNRNRRVAYYTNLKPGKHKFQVIACNNDGVWNEHGATFAITIAPHFYQTPWFYVMGGVSLALLGWGVQRFRLHMQHHIHNLERQAALDRQRARFAQDMHDEIGSMLSQIAIQAEVARFTLGRPDLAAFPAPPGLR